MNYKDYVYVEDETGATLLVHPEVAAEFKYKKGDDPVLSGQLLMMLKRELELKEERIKKTMTVGYSSMPPTHFNIR